MAQTLNVAIDLAKMQSLIDSEEMTAEDLADTMEGAELTFTGKIDALCALVQVFNDNATQCKERVGDLQRRQKMWENRAAGIRYYLMQCVQAAQRKSVKTVFNTVTVRDGKDKIIVTDVNLLPEDMKTAEISVKADMKKVEQAVKDGVTPVGVTIEPGNPSIQIR